MPLNASPHQQQAQLNFILLNLVVGGHQVLFREVADRDLVRTHEDGVLRRTGEVALAVHTEASAGLSKGRKLYSRSVSLARRLVKLDADPDSGLVAELSLANEAHGADSRHVVVAPDLAARADLVLVGDSLGRRRLEGNGSGGVGEAAKLVCLQVRKDGV